MERTSELQLAKARQILADAAARPTPERVEYVASACGDDEDLLDLVNLLMAAGASGDSQIEDATGLEPTDIDPSVPDFDQAPEMIGPYRVLEKLGEGGFGIVYAAEQTAPVKRRVALKVLKPGMDTRAVLARFEAERQVLAMLDHPNIARVLDAGETERGLPYFVMDLVKGEPIDSYCDRHRLTTEQRLKLFVSVCFATQHANSKGIVHRDLKPSNILVTFIDGQPAPKVIDFGIAKAAAGSLSELSLYTEQGVMIGTPSYMSPEQAEMTGLEIDERSDVYSLGVVLYQLLSGVLPFDPATLREKGYAELVRVLREVEPPKPSDQVSSQETNSAEMARKRGTQPRTLKRELKGELDWIVLKAMEKDRSRRYATTLDLAQDVERYLRSEPVLAGPPSALYRIRKLATRNRAIFAMAGLTLVLAVAIGNLYLATTSQPMRDGGVEVIAPHSVAVLPFDYAGPNPDEGYLGSGLSDELRDQLGRVDGLGVAARSSSLVAVQKGIDARSMAAMLGVGTILEGSMRGQGNVLTVSVALIDGKSGLAIWSDTYERSPKELLNVQREIAEAVIRKVMPDSGQAVAKAATQDATANELMILARHYEQQALEVEDIDLDLLQRAVALYRDATEADPASALALSRLAVAQMFIGDIDAGGVSASKALDLDPSLAEAHYAYGKFLFATANVRVGDEYQRAVRLNPNLPDAIHDYAFWYWFNVGTDGVAELFERALKLDRLNVARYASLGRFLAMNDRPEDARQVVDQMIALFDGAAAFRAIAEVLNILGDVDHAIAWAIKARDAEPDNALHVQRLAEFYTDIGAYETAEALEPDLGIGLLFKMRRYDEMIEKAEDWYWDYPNDVQNQIYLAVAYNAQGRYADALRILEGSGVVETLAVMRRDTIDMDAYQALLNALYASGEIEDAMEITQLVEKQIYIGDTADWWVAINVGCLYSIRGDDKEVYRRFARAREGKHLAWEPMLKDSECFERFADDTEYLKTVGHFDNLREMLRERLPDTLAQHGVAL